MTTEIENVIRKYSLIHKINLNFQYISEDLHYGMPDLITEKRLVTPVKLELPQNLSANEKSVVMDVINKKYNRFTVD